MDNLARLVIVDEIKTLKAKYFRGVDTKDMALLRSIFADDMVCDVRGSATDPVTGINAVPSVEKVLNGLEEIMTAFAGGINSFISVHQGCMPEIEVIDENNAKAIWPMFDTLRFHEGPLLELTGYGHYHETYQRIGGKWKVKHLRLTRLRVDAIPRK